MSEALKILVVAGHPADMFDHCGGTLLNHIERGDIVTCISITQGLRIHDEVISDMLRHDITKYSQEELDNICQERQRVKYNEALSACEIFGIHDVRFLNYDDEILTVNSDMISKLATVIRAEKPDIIITHWPYQEDGFSNHHAVTGQLALNAVTAATGVNFKGKEEGWRVAQIAFMLCPADTTSNCLLNSGKSAYPTYYVDVTDVIDKKIHAIYTMRSQKYDIANFAKKTTEQWNGNLGAKVRLPYAEAFAIEYPEVGAYLPLSNHRKWLAREDERKLLEHASGLQGIDVEL